MNCGVHSVPQRSVNISWRQAKAFTARSALPLEPGPWNSLARVMGR